MKLTPDYPPVWLAGFAALAWGQARILPLPGLLWPGRVLVVLGLGVMLLAVWQFARARTTIVPHEVPSALVTSGVYGYSRNPIYLADVMILSGLCLIWGAWPSLLLVPVFGVVITRRFINPEESRLKARFGVEFDAWAARVRRWI